MFVEWVENVVLIGFFGIGKIYFVIVLGYKVV